MEQSSLQLETSHPMTVDSKTVISVPEGWILGSALKPMESCVNSILGFSRASAALVLCPFSLAWLKH